MQNLHLPARVDQPRATSRFATALATLALLSACATGQYPSLERRAAELPTEPPPAAEPLPPALAMSPDTLAKLQDALAKARAAHQKFLTLAPRAESALAASAKAAPDSEETARANIALADLQSARSDTALAMADIERLYSDDRLANSLAPNPSPATAKAQSEALALLGQEDETLARLAR